MKKTLILTFLSTLFLTSFAYAGTSCDPVVDVERTTQKQDLNTDTGKKAPAKKVPAKNAKKQN